MPSSTSVGPTKGIYMQCEGHILSQYRVYMPSSTYIRPAQGTYAEQYID